MPVFVDASLSGGNLARRARWPREKSSAAIQARARCITIGLINNMPDAALQATERQFLTLLNAAADGISVRLVLYALPGVPRQEAGRSHVDRFYSSVEDLWDSHLDGLIVTGREPLAASLPEEPYWGSLTRVVDWARDNTYSTVWSCLAAHAAVLHSDGIHRRRSSDKRFGIFECAPLSDHSLTAGAPSRFKLPHSRWNDIPENALVESGYSVLTRAGDAGVDTFVKQHKSLFVFFQGHPEYEAETLLLEYRRDVKRYLRGETDRYPSLPRNYFARDTADALTALQQKAVSGRSEHLLEELATAIEKPRITNTWRSTATRIYVNWLEHICARKELRLTAGEAAAKVHRAAAGSAAGFDQSDARVG